MGRVLSEKKKARLLRAFQEKLKFNANEFGTAPYSEEAMRETISYIYELGYMSGFANGYSNQEGSKKI